MANVSAPMGLVHIGNSGGAPATFDYGQDSTVVIKLNDTNAVGYGDPMKKLSTGYYTKWTAGTNVALLGAVFQGCEYYSISLQKVIFSHYWPGNGDALYDIKCRFIPVRGTIAPKFRIQSSGAAITFASKGMNADFVMGTPSTVGNQNSTSMIDPTTVAVTATLPLHIIDTWSAYQQGYTGNGVDDTTNYNQVVVQINNAGLAGI